MKIETPGAVSRVSSFRRLGTSRHAHFIAQALVENIPIVTSDRIFRLYKGLKIIW
ncbi:MAG TPA: hypothetical protein VGF20_08865 [Candidatus Acidoferrum sp.]